MSLATDIQGIKSETFIIGIIDLLLLVTPGLMVIFLYMPDLIPQLDWVKLALISVSFTTPFVLVNTLLVFVLNREPKSHEDDMFVAFSLAIISTGILMYFSFGVLYVSGVSLKSAIIFLVVLEVIISYLTLLKKTGR